MSWWRNYVRSKTKPIALDHAMKVKRRLAMAYLFCAWNAFALGIYYVFKEGNPRKPEEKEYPSKYYARLLHSPDARVLKFEGFKLVDEYDIKGMVQPERGRTREQREKEDREREEREREEREKKEREDLNLLVEETNSL